jgi:hypothetical protein
LEAKNWTVLIWLREDSIKTTFFFQPDQLAHVQQRQLRKPEFESRPSPFGWDHSRSNGSSIRNSPFEQHRSTPPISGQGHNEDRMNRRSVPLDFQRNQIQQQIHRSASPAQAALAYKQIQSSFPVSSSSSSHQQHRLSQLQASIDARRSYINQTQI